MILNGPTRATFTYTVWRERDEPPHVGDAYRDPRGTDWTIRHVGPRVLLGGPPNMTPWSIDLGAEHGTFRIEPNEELQAVRTRRARIGWHGDIEHVERRGFGFVVQRLPAPELTYGGTTWSWLYREIGQEWVLQVGPMVEYLNYFHDPIFERRGQRDMLFEGRGHLDVAHWHRVQEALNAFQEGED